MIVNSHLLFSAAPIRNMLRTKERAHGVSHGLSEAGYDIRIKQDIRFIPAGKFIYIPGLEKDGRIGFTRHQTDEMSVVRSETGTPETYDLSKGRFTLASAIEEFQMPPDLLGRVTDKSTWARRGLSVFNTVIEPGWKGFLTLELVYHGSEELHIPAGAGIAQVLFEEVRVPAVYEGKYQNQGDFPVAPIYEKN